MDPTRGDMGLKFNKPMLLGGIGPYLVIRGWSSRNPCSLMEWVLNNLLTWDYWSSRNPCSLVEWVLNNLLTRDYWSSRNPCSLVEWVLNNLLTWDDWSSRNPCSLVEWVGPTYPVVTWDQWSRNLLECAFIGCCCSSSCWKLLGISSCQSGENDELLRENWCPRWCESGSGSLARPR